MRGHVGRERMGLEEECPVLSQVQGTFIEVLRSTTVLFLWLLATIFVVATFFVFLGEPPHNYRF
jgi:hypothetical protein